MSCTPFIYSWIIASIVPADGDRPTQSGDGAGNNDASVPTLNAELQNATQGNVSISKS
jgi:hypothetical protein